MRTVTIGELQIAMYDRDRSRLYYQIYDEVFARNVYESENCRIYEGDSVLDVGCHVGMFTMFALSRGAKKITSVDLFPYGTEAFHANVKFMNKEAEVTCLRHAVWNKSNETLPVYLNRVRTGSDTVVNPNRRRLPAPVISVAIDDLVKEKVHFIKIDAEGSEPRIIEGAERTIKEYLPNMAICLYHDPDDERKVLALLDSFGVEYEREYSRPVHVADEHGIGLFSRGRLK